MLDSIQIISFLIIAYQDLRNRLVDITLFLLLSLTLMPDYFTVSEEGNETLLMKSIAILIVITLFLIGKSIFQMPLFKKEFIGEGDVFLLVILWLLFPVQTFLIMLISASVTGILHGLYLRIRANKNYTIPFCTHLAMVACFVQLNEIIQTKSIEL